MEQQQTKLPLEWLSSRRTPELHRLEQLCRETAREHRCAQRRLPAAGVGHPDVGGDPLLGQLLLLSAAVAARRRLDCALHLGYDGLLGHAGLVRQPPGVDISRRGADAPLGQDADGLADIAQPTVITAQVVLGLRFFQLELRRVSRAV